MTAPTPNAELAYAVLDHIDAHPEQWRQGEWAACFAGWAVRLSGVQLDAGTDRVFDGPAELLGLEIDEAADRLLGITTELLNEREHGDPYDGLHTRESLGSVVAEIFGTRPHDVGSPDGCRRCREGGLTAELAWRECAYRDDYSSAAHHEGECPFHNHEVDDVPPNAGSAS
jgi:hypothetical protein